jgi:hypothetical protein
MENVELNCEDEYETFMTNMTNLSLIFSSKKNVKRIVEGQSRFLLNILLSLISS